MYTRDSSASSLCFITRRRLITNSTAALATAIAAPSLVGRARAADNPPPTLKLAHSGSQDWQGNRWAQNFAEALAERVPGAKVELYPNAQLGQDPALTQAVKLGTLDITVQGPVLEQYVPSLAVLDLPFLYRTMADAHKAQDGPVGGKIKAESDKAGFRFLGWIDIGMRSVTNSRRPINTLADFKGLKLRVPPGKIFLSTFQALGASTQSIDFGELYTAMQQGVVDGEENPPTTVRVQKYYEVQKYFSLTRHIASFAYAVINKRVFDRQPDSVRKAIEEAGAIATQKGRDFVAADESESLAFLKQKGMEINEPSDPDSFRLATRPVLDEAGSALKALAEEIMASRG
jgi:tripartite ATP-independent transporter DctP family solute receptor